MEPVLTSVLTAISQVTPSLTPKSERKVDWDLLQRRIAATADRAIQEHQKFVNSWVVETHALPFGLSPKATQETVELQLATGLRRWDAEREPIAELELFSDSTNYVVLGDPGAGKSTTLRRIARHVLSDPRAVGSADNSALVEGASLEDWRFVFVVICREFDAKAATSLYDILRRLFGISRKLVEEIDNPDQIVRAIIGQNAVLLVDGLDETSRLLRSGIDRDLVELARLMPSLKIIATCRSADYTFAHEGFAQVEIQPLDQAQIEYLVRSWLGETEAERFLSSIDPDVYPARDLLDRPLFLAQMVGTFKPGRDLPRRPADLCRSIVRLVLEHWDEQRGVQNRSRLQSAYAAMDTEDRLAFLADLAFALMKERLQVFSDEQLQAAYSAVAPRYEDLSATEADMVAREIESHTGLIVQVGNSFQFSHLSIHEYLAAESMVRRPWARQGSLLSNPAVAAVAIALSTDATSSLEAAYSSLVPMLGSSLGSFTHRLGQERPRLLPSAKTGLMLLKLMDKLGGDADRYMSKLVSLENSRRSLETVLTDGNLAVSVEGEMVLIVDRQHDGETSYWAPRSLVEEFVRT